MSLPTVTPVSGDVVMGVQSGVIKFFPVDDLLGGGTGTGTDGASAYELAGGDAQWGTLQAWLDSLQGANGASAYEAAGGDATWGTQQAWLNSLQGSNGASAYELAGGDAEWGSLQAWIDSIEGVPGDPGASAYELAYAANPNIGTQAQWIASLKGEPGVPGQSAYQLAGGDATWGNLQAYLDSLVGPASTVPGPSAYEVAGGDAQWGNVDAWLASLVGPQSTEPSTVPGPAGPSAYELAGGDATWGSLEAWLLSLQGEASTVPGPQGDKGEPGTDGSLGEMKTVVAEGGTNYAPGPGSYNFTGATPPTESNGTIIFDGSTFSTALKGNIPLPNSKSFEVKFTVSNYVSGETAIRLYGNGQFAEGPRVSGNGQYTQTIDLVAGTGGSNTNTVAIVGFVAPVTMHVKVDSIYELGGGSVTRQVVDKIRELGVSFLDYYEDTDGNDYAPAISRALAVSKNLLLPDGRFPVSNPFPAVDGMHLHGTNKRGEGCVFVAPNGLFYNTSATVRKSYIGENFKIEGSRLPGSIAISGPFGGRLENVYIEGFHKHVENAFGFLFEYIRCNFRDCDYSLHLAVTNGVNIEGCFWSADCIVAVDTVTLPASDTSGGTAPVSLPMRFSNVNNINRNGINYPYDVAVRLCGFVEFKNNYMEDYGSGAPNDGVLVEFQSHRFAGASLEAAGNEMNGQGGAKHAFRLYGSHNLACPINAIITRNRFLGFSGADEIQCGTVANPDYNYLPNLRVFHNFSSVGAAAGTVGNLRPEAIYRPLVRSGFSSAIAVAGTTTGTAVRLPMGTTPKENNCNGIIGTYGQRTRKEGMFDVKAQVRYRSTGNDYRNIVTELRRNGVIIEQVETTLIHSSTGDSFATAEISLPISCAESDTFEVWAYNGQHAVQGTMSLIWRGDDHY